MKKNFIVFLLSVFFLFFAVSCGSAANQRGGRMYGEVKHIAPYLHEITFDDYVQDVDVKTASPVETFGCSAVRNGNFYGRNLDYIFSDVPEFIVHVKSKEGRFASVGVASNAGMREKGVLDGIYDKQIELIPNGTYDGINENGVVCNINVVPIEDTAKITGTNPSSKNRINVCFIVRYVLDNAKSADHAVELLKECDIYGDLLGKFDAHFMIADKDKTYIVEFLDNKVVAKEKKGSDRIMTNFYHNLDYLTEHAMGTERYDILRANYDEGATFDGMFNLLKRVQYSNEAREMDPLWLTDFSLTQTQIKDKAFIENYTATRISAFREKFWKIINSDDRRLENGMWITVHNTTYDIEKKMFRIVVQEDYGHPYDFYL